MAVDFKAKQYEFTQYIRNPLQHPLPADVKPERMAMYRELIFNNIDGFLSGNFPVIRQIYSDDAWFALAQDFFVNHSAKTPYFAEIAEEFLYYLEHERQRPDDFPFLLELAHYEWVEMALSIATDEVLPNSTALPFNPAQRIKLSPLAWPLVYRFPVQLISPEYLPLEAPEQPTCLVVYRDLSDEIKFSVINPITYRLLELLQTVESISVEDCLAQIAAENRQIDQEAILAGGQAILQDLISKNVVLSIR